MKAVIDTNVLLSGLLWRGQPGTLLQRVRDGSISLVTSPALLAELARVIDRPKFDAILERTNTSREGLLSNIERLADVIDPRPLPSPVCRDPDDDAVLAVAIAGGADLIVSGDGNLLSLSRFRGIPIVSPAEAVLRTAPAGAV